MIALAEIEQLPLREKLKVMEALWESISQKEDEVEVPQWHKDLLNDRERMVQTGSAKFIEWETAKQQLKEATS